MSFEAIEDDYTGPKLDDGKVTLKFITDLLDWYKDQNKLHRRYAYQVCDFQMPAVPAEITLPSCLCIIFLYIQYVICGFFLFSADLN